jgi:L-aminopeptidase/D-esterase-like protein
VAETTEEAAFNAMVAADTVEGRDGNTLYGFAIERLVSLLKTR